MYLGVRKEDHRRVAIKAIDRKVTKPLPPTGAASNVLNEVRAILVTCMIRNVVKSIYSFVM